MKKHLAINGGPKVRTEPFICQNFVKEGEQRAVRRVLDSGRLSHFRGNYTPNFYGGPEILALEEEWSRKVSAKFAIAVNSCTSALQIACGAIGLGPGDEVIVTPWSMSCSATAPLIWNAVPRFADIEVDYYCLDPTSVALSLTQRTKAIIAVDLFGQPYDADFINSIAKTRNIKVIEDAAQAVGSTYKGKQAGTLGDIGVFSLTVGKHMSSGEGGMMVTDDPVLAQRCRLIRNHAEAVVHDMISSDQSLCDYLNLSNNMLGFNMRMTEIEAAIAREQLKRFPRTVFCHKSNANYLYGKLGVIPPIIPSPIREGCTHSYYVQAFKWDSKAAEGIHRDVYINAVKAELAPEKGRETEGVPIGCGYIKPLYLFPLFQLGRLYGGTRYPFRRIDTSHYATPNLCPVAEKLWKDELFVHHLVGPELNRRDLDDIVRAFEKVWFHKEELR